MKSREQIFNIATFSLSVISFFADILGIGRLAFDIIVEGNLENLGFKILILVLVFVFGAGIGVISIQGFRNASLPLVAQFYAWIYVLITCLSYIGIIFVLKKQNYDFLTFFAFIVIIVSELMALYGLNIVVEELDYKLFSIPILTITLIHLVLVAYSYIYKSTPASFYLAGDLFFFLSMTTIGSAMIGDIGFITLIRKTIDRLK